MRTGSWGQMRRWGWPDEAADLDALAARVYRPDFRSTIVRTGGLPDGGSSRPGRCRNAAAARRAHFFAKISESARIVANLRSRFGRQHFLKSVYAQDSGSASLDKSAEYRAHPPRRTWHQSCCRCYQSPRAATHATADSRTSPTTGSHRSRGARASRYRPAGQRRPVSRVNLPCTRAS
jgi:hypothetical protein